MGKLHTIDEPQNTQHMQQEENQLSIVQTDFIDESKNLSRLGSQEEGINSTPMKPDQQHMLNVDYQL